MKTKTYFSKLKQYHSWHVPFFSLLVLLILSNLLIGGEEKALQFSVDHSKFKLQKDYVYLELYYSIPRQNLNFKQMPDGFLAQIQIKSYLTFNNNSILVDSLQINDMVNSLNEISPSQNLIEMSALQIKAGDYLLTTKFIDLLSNLTETYNDSLHLMSFPNDQLAISDIELANSITIQPSKISKFDKNGLRVIPNASRTFGTGLNNLCFYAEAYYLDIEKEAANSTYHLEYCITDQNGKKAKEISGTPKQKPGRSCVIHGSLGISDLASGFYSFQIHITDDFNQNSIQSEKDFFVYKIDEFVNRIENESQTDENIIENEFSNMDEVALDYYFEQVKYIAQKDEKKLFKKLDLEGKRNFLNNFWTTRDPNPATTINERKKEYHELLDYANQYFSLGKRQGWKTDRGRVLLVYGKPDQVDRISSSPDLKAHQIWYYFELEGGVEFVFVDVRLISDYLLIHSTKRDEIRDYDWVENWAKR